MIVSQNYLLIFSFAVFLWSLPMFRVETERKRIFSFSGCQLLSCVLGYSRIRNCFCWHFDWWVRIVQMFCDIWKHMLPIKINQMVSKIIPADVLVFRLCIVRTMNVKVLFSDTLKRHCKLGEDSVECRMDSDWVPRDLSPSVCRVENNLCCVENNLCIECHLDIHQQKWEPKRT